jgi:hypothetical protein
MSDYNAATWYQQLGNNGYGPHSKSAELAQSYVKAQGEEEKTRIRKKLTEVLSEQFDQHSKKQEKELEEIEKQIANLKGLLKRRLDAKSTIVERRADQLIRDADGLGWTAPSSPNLYSIPHPAWTTLPSDSPKQPAAATPLAK